MIFCSSLQKSASRKGDLTEVYPILLTQGPPGTGSWLLSCEIVPYTLTPLMVDWTRGPIGIFTLLLGLEARETEKHRDREIWSFREAVVGLSLL